MNYTPSFDYRHYLHEEIILRNFTCSVGLKFVIRNKQKILKIFLLCRLHQLICTLFQSPIQHDQLYNNSSMECYNMDCKIMQLLIYGIVETGEYTLEGIAYYTKIPFDVILDAACGNNTHLSITLWTKIVELYIQLKPDVSQILVDKLIEMKGNNYPLSSLLNEL